MGVRQLETRKENKLPNILTTILLEMLQRDGPAKEQGLYRDGIRKTCPAELKVLLLQKEHPVGWVYVHKGTLKASKMAIGAGSSRTTNDSQRYHMNVLWKSSRGKGEGREGTKPQVTGPWSRPNSGCPGGG